MEVLGAVLRSRAVPRRGFRSIRGAGLRALDLADDFAGMAARTGWEGRLFCSPGRRCSKPEFGQTRMIRRPRLGAVPVILAVGFFDGNVVDAGVAQAHQPVLVELPILVAVRAVPVVGVVVPLVGEA